MPPAQQDHVVLLVDNATFENLPDWITENFTVTPGGYHNGQSSRNKLIIFADGTYLELFSWYDRPPPLHNESLPMRFWGPKSPGLIDFALTDTTYYAEQRIDSVNNNLLQSDRDAELGVKFGTPLPGSRKKADGEEIKWKVTRPEFSRGRKTPSEGHFPSGRIDVPFFCHDLTPRYLRVPCHDAAKATHPCGAIGIAACEILVPGDLLLEYASLYAKVLGSRAEFAADYTMCTFHIGVPVGSAPSKVVVSAAVTEEDNMRINERGVGFSDLVIATQLTGPNGVLAAERRPLGPTGVEATIWLRPQETH